VKTGDPMPCFTSTMVEHLESLEEAQALAQSINETREAWKARNGIRE